MTITVNGGNGVVINFPDGTDHATINAVMAQALGHAQSAPAAEPKTSGTEAFLRAAADTGSFGLANGLQDRERMHEARKEHPYVSFAGDAAGVIGQTLALAPVAAAGRVMQGVRYLANAGKAIEGGANAARAVIAPNTEARTLGEVIKTGAKVGGVNSALHGAGDALTNPEAGWSDVPKQAAAEGAFGTLGGAVLGPAFHGVAKGVGAVAGKVMPNLSEAKALAGNPDLAGTRDIMRAAAYDGVRFGDIADRINVRAPDGSGLSDEIARNVAGRMNAGESAADVARATGLSLDHVTAIGEQEATLRRRYADLNTLEAVKSGDLVRSPNTGELRPEIRTTRNLDQTARWAANQEGIGQNIAADAFAHRKDAMGDLITRDVTQAFGAGNRASDQAATEAAKLKAGKQFDRLRDRGQWLVSDALAPLKEHPEFQRALNTAAANDIVRGESTSMSRWGKDAHDGVTDIFTPANLLDINHHLVLASKPNIADPASAFVAGELKKRFQAVVDEHLKKYPAIRDNYGHVRDVMTATEMGAQLPLASGGSQHESLQFLLMHSGDLNASQQALAAAERKLAVQQDKVTRGAHVNALNSAKGQVNAARAEVERKAAIVEEFRKAWGNSIVDQIAAAPDPFAVTRKLLTGEGKARILQVLGQEKGASFIEQLYNKRTQQQLGNTLYGGSDTAWKTNQNDTVQALSKMASGVMHMRPMQVLESSGDLLSKNYSQGRADRINALMSRQGIDNVREIVAAILAHEKLANPTPQVNNALLNLIAPSVRTGREQLR